MKRRITAQTPEEYWDRVTLKGDCWVWAGSSYSHGYGLFRNRSAVRTAYEALKGEIPAGKRLKSTCRTAGCVNPEHHTITNREEWRTPVRPGHGVSWHPQARMWAVVVQGQYVGIYEDEYVAYRAVIAHRKTQGTLDSKRIQLASDLGLPEETPEQFFEQNPTRRHDADNKPRHQGLGISWCKQTRQWQAKANPSGKQKQLGRFKNEADAYRAALEFLVEGGGGETPKASKLKRAITDTENA